MTVIKVIDIMQFKNTNPIVYIESSVISYIASRPSRDIVIAARQAISHDWWENHRQKFDLRVSALVEEEVSRGDTFASQRRVELIENIPSLAISYEATNLAELLVTQHAIPEGSEEDALHISIASSQGVDFFLTWNFKHINNAEMKSKIVKTVESCGFVCPQICSPEELGGTSDD